MTNESYFAGDEDSSGWCHDTGKPGINLFGNAIQVWAIMQAEGGSTKQPTIRNAALAFNSPDAMIREAVEAHYWMLVTGPDDDPTKQFIEHEGE